MAGSVEEFSSLTYKILTTLGLIVKILFLDLPRDFIRWRTLKPKDVTGQVIVITGGGSGLGRKMAVSLAAKGANMALIDVNEAGLKETAEEIRSAGGSVEWHVCDITKADELNALGKKIEEEMGPVEIVICNAAVLYFAFFMDLTQEQLQRACDVNIMGTINTIRAFLGRMEERNRGHVVGISSITGYAGETYGLAYCPSKFAMRGIMESLQMEMRDRGLDGIKCTTVCPYFARTPMVLNIGIRPTSTWIPFMSPESCARRILDAVLKEKVLAFQPNYVCLVSILRTLASININKSLRDYLDCRYSPPNYVSDRKILPIMPDFFRAVPSIWWAIIPPALLINYLAWTSPATLDTALLPVIGPFAAHVGRSYPWFCWLSNWGALVAHFGEAIYALTLCDRLKFSHACTLKWFVQTFIFGFPSLSMLTGYANKQGKGK